MANRALMTTPPPPSSIHTPSTPKHGWEDGYQPYSPRKSSRISKRAQRAEETPPPSTSLHNLRSSHSSPASNGQKIASKSLQESPPSTFSRDRNSKNTTAKGRSVSGTMDAISTAAAAAAALGLSAKKHESHQSTATERTNGMLPTPVKTPNKRPSQAHVAITSIARTLFLTQDDPVEEVMPPPKKGLKKHIGFTLGSLDEETEAAPIKIYTDSQDRVPEVDLSADNPFYGNATAAVPEPTKTATMRKKIIVPGEGEQTVEEVEQREDGLVYVFRGKKIFRKFADEDDMVSNPADTGSQDNSDALLDATVPEQLRGPLTRSSIKPRLLFPTEEQIAAKEKTLMPSEDEKEEVLTDIEDVSDEVTTPRDQTITPATPKAPKFGPVSPPTTARVTRSTKNAHMDIPRSPSSPSVHTDHVGRGGDTSPFTRWYKTKTAGHGKKRSGDLIVKNEPGTPKKQRN